VSPDSIARHRWKWWVRQVGFVLLVVVIYFGVRVYQQRTLVAGPAPLLQATQLDGTRVVIGSAAGEPMLVYFWATWCPVCRLEEGVMQSVARHHRVVAIAMQSGADDVVTGYLKEHRLQLPVVNDPDGVLAATWGVRATPTHFVVDRTGQIRFREVGSTTEMGLRWRLWWAAR